MDYGSSNSGLGRIHGHQETGGTSGKTSVDQIDVFFDEGQRAAAYALVIACVPISFHDAPVGMAAEALQNVRDFVDQYVGKHGGSQRLAISSRNAVMENTDMDAFERGQGDQNGWRRAIAESITPVNGYPNTDERLGSDGAGFNGGYVRAALEANGHGVFGWVSRRCRAQHGSSAY